MDLRLCRDFLWHSRILETRASLEVGAPGARGLSVRFSGGTFGAGFGETRQGGEVQTSAILITVL